MIDDAINNWIENAASGKHAVTPPADEGVRVIRRQPKSNGAVIMEIAEKLRPWFLKMFEGVRDENGMTIHPSHVRGIALNVAQDIVKKNEEQSTH